VEGAGGGVDGARGGRGGCRGSDGFNGGGNDDGNWTERTEKLVIETALLQENERRFNQAKDTPFLVPPLNDLIGTLGIGPHADAVLEGTFVAPPGTDPYAVKLLYHLKKDPAVDQAPPMPLDLPLAECVIAAGNALGNELHQGRLIYISDTTSPAPRTGT
jgi:hypothetical protein